MKVIHAKFVLATEGLPEHWTVIFGTNLDRQIAITQDALAGSPTSLTPDKSNQWKT